MVLARELLFYIGNELIQLKKEKHITENHIKMLSYRRK